jgi:hypothetical protein
MPSILSFIGMLILPGALWIFVSGVIKCRIMLTFVRLSLLTTGKVVEFKEESDVHRTYYRPVVEFCLNEKFKFRFQAAEANRWKPAYKIGETVGVRYLPDDPNVAQINSFRQVWGSVTDALVVGIIFTLAALLLLGKLF